MSKYRPSLIGLWLRHTGRFPQPQRHVLRLHGLPDYGYEIRTQIVQVRLLPQSGSEAFQRLLGVVFVPVETTIDEGLEAAPQGVEERGYRQGRGHDDESGILASQGAEGVLQTDHASEIEQRQRHAQ